MSEQKVKTKDDRYDKVSICHARLHTGYQIGKTVYMSLDTTRMKDLKMWFLPDSGALEVHFQGEEHFIGSGMWHGARKT